MSIREVEPTAYMVEGKISGAKIISFDKADIDSLPLPTINLFTEEDAMKLICEAAAYIGGWAHGAGRHGNNSFEDDVPVILNEIQKWLNGKEDTKND